MDNQDAGPLYRTIQDDIDEAKAKEAEALEVLAAAQSKRMAEFQEKLNALCAEYKVVLQVQQNIGIVPSAA